MGASMGPHSFECGITAGYVPRGPDMSVASMGPHSFECGIGSTVLRRRVDGGCFNGAALIRVRNSILREAAHAIVAKASMGPHSFECGIEVRLPSGGVEASSASMGPHSFECGISRCQLRGLRWLSSRFNGAALIRVRNT